MRCGRSSRCINVLIGLALAFSLISIILGILTYGLPYIFQFSPSINFGFFQNCIGVINCSQVVNLNSKNYLSDPKHISAFSLYAAGIFFNFISLLIIIICVGRANKKYILIYMKLVVRIIVFVLLLIASSGYLIGMVILSVRALYQYSPHAMFIVGWIGFGFSALATIMICITLCGKGVNSSSSSHTKTDGSHTNYTYETDVKFTPTEDVNLEVYRMYSRN